MREMAHQGSVQDKRCQVTSVPGRVPDLQEAALGDGQESIVGGKHGSFHGRLKVEAVQAETPGDADDHNPALSVERQEKRPRPVCAKPADVTSALNRKGVRGVVGELKDRNAIANSTKEEFVAVGPPIGCGQRCEYHVSTIVHAATQPCKLVAKLHRALFPLL